MILWIVNVMNNYKIIFQFLCPTMSLLVKVCMIKMLMLFYQKWKCLTLFSILPEALMFLLSTEVQSKH